jgi:tetratricopeptide (TPR) repeat protein
VGDPDEAQRFFEQLIGRDSGLPGAYHNLGVCHFLRAEYDEGIRRCEEAVALKQDYALARRKLVLAHMHLGHWQRARRVLEESLALDPGDPALRRIRQRWTYRRIVAAVRWLTGRFSKLVMSPDRR